MDRYLVKKVSDGDDDTSQSPGSSSAAKRPKLDSDGPGPGQSNSLAQYNPTEICSFGEKCYRRNIHHFREYRHLHRKY